MWQNPRMTDTPASEQPDGLDWSRVSRFNRDKPQVDYPGSLQATSAASFLSGAAWLFTVLVVIGGFVLVIYSDPLYDRMTDVSFFMQHPYAVTGIACVIAGSMQMMTIVMVANFVKATTNFQAEAGAFFLAFKQATESSTSSTTSTPVAKTEALSGVHPKPPLENLWARPVATPTEEGNEDDSERLGLIEAYTERQDKQATTDQEGGASSAWHPAPTLANTRLGLPASHKHVPGWYPDPYGDDLRWWDGREWADL
jgi:hypothetical protein